MVSKYRDENSSIVWLLQKISAEKLFYSPSEMFYKLKSNEIAITDHLSILLKFYFH